MKDYSKMSDFEIDKAVSTALGMDASGATEENNIMYGCFDDVCNNPSDAWPLIESNLICLMADVFCEPQDGGKWIAQPAYGWQHERVRNDNPLRAAMIVYLMMKDGEK